MLLSESQFYVLLIELGHRFWRRYLVLIRHKHTWVVKAPGVAGHQKLGEEMLVGKAQ